MKSSPSLPICWGPLTSTESTSNTVGETLEDDSVDASPWTIPSQVGGHKRRR